MKKLRKVFLVLLLLIVVALVALYFYVDTIAKSAIEKGATYALGVDTTVDGVSIGLFTGKFSLAKLAVKNPEGYNAENKFFGLGEGNVEVSLSSLMGDKIQVPSITFSDINVSLERRKGKANYDVILGNLGKFESKDDKTPAETDKGEGKRFIVDLIEIKNVNIHIDMLPELGELTKVDLKIPAIKLTGVGSESDKGVLISELTNIMLKAVLQAAAEKGEGLIPLEMLGDLKGHLAKLENLEGMGIKMTNEVMTKVNDEINKVTKDINDKVNKEIEKVTKDITKDLGKDVIPKDLGKDLEKDLGKDLGGGLKGLGDGLFGKDKKE